MLKEQKSWFMPQNHTNFAFMDAGKAGHGFVLLRLKPRLKKTIKQTELSSKERPKVWENRHGYQ
ncbi:hypothetical protein ASD8599_00224 [Ascidiaceihabitans donghaensis]|uniref:Uncharacterized protein n=1 Tax=Ascidiaceihabitans donghaensis TaxID=1510460 RepID=A0A2R8B901_9RHOB|nr:hypothetical protein ASD8599_00224 [Ascidiaceihabitans donghaensis]